ncbi:MAG: signal recognition particle-docking protein FtsY [Myxococcaceae bacterium]
MTKWLSFLEGVPAWALAAVGVSLLALFVLLLSRRRQKGLQAIEPASSPPTAEPKGLPVETPVVAFAPSERESQALAVQADARAKAEALTHERIRVLQAGETAEALALKAQEEEAKREAYRAKKIAEQEAKERRRLELEEAERLRAEATARAQAEAEAAAQARASEERARISAQSGQTLAQGLTRTREQGFVGRLARVFGAPRALDEAALGDLEEVLFGADIGVRTATRLVELARDRATRATLRTTDGLLGLIREEVERVVSLPTGASLEGGGPPHVVMVVGVNGAGKTTTIGKLAAKRAAAGTRVVMAAADTFRAAATEQLDVWAERAQAILVKGAEGSDPGAVAFDGVKRAQALGAGLVLVDTAGRLHTKAPLMEELKKVKRVLSKALPGAPHEVLLVLDATMGQNAIAQAREFHDAVGVSSIVLTKLDGTAKGGVIIGISDELKLPVSWVGVGETVNDLRRFAPNEFVSALFDTLPPPNATKYSTEEASL